MECEKGNGSRSNEEDRVEEKIGKAEGSKGLTRLSASAVY